jgi:hypothetical protein
MVRQRVAIRIDVVVTTGTQIAGVAHVIAI